MYRAELEQQEVNDVEKMMSTQFAAWFENHVCAASTTWLNNLWNSKFWNSLILYVFNLQITTLKYQGSTHVDEDLYSLACRPDLRVRSYTSCIINGVRYHTLARDEHRKTQNSTIKSAGTHGYDIIDFYGTIKDIIELSYNKNSKGQRTVVLLRCEWYNLEGRTY